MEHDINLLDFCKKYNGAFAAVFPNDAAGKIISAYADGTISKRDVAIVLEQFLSQIAAVALVDGMPRVFWKKS